MTTHERLIELVPDIVVNKHAQLIKHDRTVEHFVQCRDITLADVLRAMEPIPGTRLDTAGGYWEQRHNLLALWNLALPFHLQPQDTQDFIGRIIGAEV